MSGETITRQQDSLVSAIKDLEKRELKRLTRLSNAKSRSEQQSLNERFERERQSERERVEYLMSDYFAVEQQLKNSEVKSFLEDRKTFKITQSHKRRDDANLPNRFEGIETHIDMIFHADVVKKFDKHDKRFQARLNHVPYDPIKEERKLQLLTEKKTLLQNLIKLQSTSDGSGASSYRMNTGRRPDDTYSVASGSTGVSYATFASSRVGGSSANAIIPRNNRQVVPKLNLK